MNSGELAKASQFGEPLDFLPLDYPQPVTELYINRHHANPVTMFTEVIDHLYPVFREAVSDLIVVAVRGGLLVWGVFMGKLLGTGFFESPSRLKVVLISMPMAVIVATLFALYSFKSLVNPGETRAEAVHDAELTFFLVLLPLWIGCLWGTVNLNPDRILPSERDA